MKPLYYAPVAVILFFGLVFWWSGGLEGQAETPATMVGRDAPGLELAALPGEPLLTREKLNGGGVKLVNFWASWCAPCRVEHPNLVKLQKAGVPVYGVNFKDDPAQAAAFLAELGNPYAALGTDADGRNGFGWGLFGLPETYLIDDDGKVLARVAGAVTTSSFARDLGPALEAAGMPVTLGK